MPTKLHIMVTTILCISGLVTHAQQLNLFLQDIKEVRFNGETQRSTSDSISSITFTTAINGLRLDDYHLIKLQNLKVTDETGKTLPEIKDTFYKNGRYVKDKRMEIITIAPDRPVTKVTAIEGTLQYFTPTEANKGRVIIRDFLHRKDENLLKPTYPDIVLKVMDTEKLFDMEEALRKMMDEAIENRKKEGPISDKEQEEIIRTRELLDDINGFNAHSSVHNTLTFELNGALESFFHRFSIRNKKKQIINSGYTQVGHIYQFYLTEQPTEDCFIEILIENKEAVKELPFHLSNILLP